jgi:predicted outer membrane repeat protein
MTNIPARFEIVNLILTGADHTLAGGAVYITNGTFIATNCSFINNTAGSGGAIFAGSSRYNVNVITRNCSFINNVALSNLGGGAVCLYSGEGLGTYSAFNCDFFNNVTNGCGGAILIFCAGVAVDKCSFIENVAGHGGAVCVSRGSFIATNSTFRLNLVDHTIPFYDHDWGGGAICLY